MPAGLRYVGDCAHVLCWGEIGGLPLHRVGFEIIEQHHTPLVQVLDLVRRDKAFLLVKYHEKPNAFEAPFFFDGEKSDDVVLVYGASNTGFVLSL